MRTKRNKWDSGALRTEALHRDRLHAVGTRRVAGVICHPRSSSCTAGPSAPQDAATPEALRKKAQEAAAKLMAQRQHEQARCTIPSELAPEQNSCFSCISISLQAMCEDIIINDHPINIRDQLTRRAALVPVEQQTGTSIIVKGRYYPPGAPRAPNSPPLLLHITAAQHVVMVRRPCSQHWFANTMHRR